jgi:hypothetical protein
VWEMAHATAPKTARRQPFPDVVRPLKRWPALCLLLGQTPAYEARGLAEGKRVISDSQRVAGADESTSFPRVLTSADGRYRLLERRHLSSSGRTLASFLSAGSAAPILTPTLETLAAMEEYAPCSCASLPHRGIAASSENPRKMALLLSFEARSFHQYPRQGPPRGLGSNVANNTFSIYVGQ